MVSSSHRVNQTTTTKSKTRNAIQANKLKRRPRSSLTALTFTPLVRFVSSPHIGHFQEFHGSSAVEAFQELERVFKLRIRDFGRIVLGGISDLVAVDEGDVDSSDDDAESVRGIVDRQTMHFAQQSVDVQMVDAHRVEVLSGGN